MIAVMKLKRRVNKRNRPLTVNAFAMRVVKSPRLGHAIFYERMRFTIRVTYLFKSALYTDCYANR